MTRFWQDSESRTKRLLRNHWSEVEAIAQAMLVESDLSGNQARRIIHQAANGRNPEIPDPAAVTAEINEKEHSPANDSAKEIEDAEGTAPETLPEVQY
jgi:hypothetical protein